MSMQPGVKETQSSNEEGFKKVPRPSSLAELSSNALDPEVCVLFQDPESSLKAAQVILCWANEEQSDADFQVIMTDKIGAYIFETSQPYQRVLEILQTGAIPRKKIGKLDVPCLMLQSLECVNASGCEPREEDRRHFARFLTSSPSSLSNTAVEVGVSAYRFQDPESQYQAIASALLTRRAYREAAECIRRFHLHHHFDLEPVLERLISKKIFDTVERFGADYTALRPFIITNIAESGCGDNPNLALRLIDRWSLNKNDFPRVLYLKKKNCLWFTLVSNKFADFADIICRPPNTPAQDIDEFDLKLRTYACRQLLKGRFVTDRALFDLYVQAYQLQMEFHMETGQGDFNLANSWLSDKFAAELQRILHLEKTPEEDQEGTKRMSFMNLVILRFHNTNDVNTNRFRNVDYGQLEYNFCQRQRFVDSRSS